MPGQFMPSCDKPGRWTVSVLPHMVSIGGPMRSAQLILCRLGNLERLNGLGVTAWRNAQGRAGYFLAFWWARCLPFGHRHPHSYLHGRQAGEDATRPRGDHRRHSTGSVLNSAALLAGKAQVDNNVPIVAQRYVTTQDPSDADIITVEAARPSVVPTSRVTPDC